MSLGFSILLIGKKFWNSGNRYEGEWENGKRHGQGKKNDLLNYLLILTLLLGKFFGINGDRYEGEWGNDK